MAVLADLYRVLGDDSASVLEKPEWLRDFCTPQRACFKRSDTPTVPAEGPPLVLAAEMAGDRGQSPEMALATFAALCAMGRPSSLEAAHLRADWPVAAAPIFASCVQHMMDRLESLQTPDPLLLVLCLEHLRALKRLQAHDTVGVRGRTAAVVFKQNRTLFMFHRARSLMAKAHVDETEARVNGSTVTSWIDWARDQLGRQNRVHDVATETGTVQVMHDIEGGLLCVVDGTAVFLIRDWDVHFEQGKTTILRIHTPTFPPRLRELVLHRGFLLPKALTDWMGDFPIICLQG